MKRGKIQKTLREKSIAILLTISIHDPKDTEGSKTKARQEDGILME